MRLRGGAAYELVMGCINVDNGVAGKQVTNGRSCRRTAAKGDNSLVRQGLRNGLGFHCAERCLAVGGKNLCDTPVLTFDDEGICIDVAHAEALGQETPNL